MMSRWLDLAYRNSPIWLQNLGIAAYGVAWKRRRLGGRFREDVVRFQTRDEFSVEQWRDYQTRRLRELLWHCLLHVPHYRRVWGRLGITQWDVERFEIEDLASLPTTEKEAVRDTPNDFLAETTNPRRLHTYQTSGSTGTPLSVRMSSATHQTWSAAYEVRCRNWAGVNCSMSRAMIGGRFVVPKSVTGPPYWRYNPIERQLYLSIYHIGPQQVAEYATAINRFRPDYLVGYASAHYFLARLIEEAALEVHSPKAVLTSSEKLTAEMRFTLHRVYRCPVFDAYSGVEACCLASECSHHHLHVSPDVGIVELVDADGHIVQPGDPGAIIATGLLNFDQPLVRYRTGDIAAWSSEACPCGRPMPVLGELIGRLEDTIIGLDGREIVGFNRFFNGLDYLREVQVVQDAVDQFTLRVVLAREITPAEEQALVDLFRERLGEVRVTILSVPAIERTERGKFRAVISRVPRAAVRTPAGQSR